ncbi:hypothetical protein ASPSYDRAFT_435077 [Aspergillus sydowii CBS 593.65]|uniref:Transcription factor domain-containing protein n=1 Tax=Aspergillus sydowii CBS 593.65 TaxID=1036612 RepID=A0A1L9T6J2_9EURO|nr:uncharacterized protein ASPSYDRAFT_435077 [Aspergillus sydowii CBS 593.65]OJJ54903.1 hypothetical protein ASPSYDRAFT_435077 [Aspergillus sydowii CBS 593.65]
MRCTPMVHPHGDTNLDSGAMAHISQSTATPGQHNPRMEQDETNQRITIHSDEYYYFSRNVWLRARLNRIISEMYTTDQAYCKPENVASIVTEISLELECWYRSLPMDLHFTRDVKSFQIRQPRMSTRLKEISLRYHSCLLALNRPVLYWVLYEDLENSNPTPSSSSASGIVYAEQQPESWLFPSCRKCIESAKMIILTLLSWARQCEGGEGEGMVSLTWCETQLLVGSFAVLLSVQTATSFSYAFPDAIDIGHLLDTVEELLSTFGTLSLADRQTLEILLNMKRNFEVSSPVALMT